MLQMGFLIWHNLSKISLNGSRIAPIKINKNELILIFNNISNFFYNRTPEKLNPNIASTTNE